MNTSQIELKKMIQSSEYFKNTTNAFYGTTEDLSDDDKLIKKCIDNCAMLLIVRKMKEGYIKPGNDQFTNIDIKKVIDSGDIICKIIVKRLELFNIDVIIPAEFLEIISICSQGNPGMALLITRELLMKIKNLQHGQIITSEQFVSVFPDSFPLVLIPNICEKYDSAWDSQKCSGDQISGTDNLIDTAEYWHDVFFN